MEVEGPSNVGSRGSRLTPEKPIITDLILYLKKIFINYNIMVDNIKYYSIVYNKYNYGHFRGIDYR